jgi:aspartyl-tRNA(Asn)/glutamyl-tRNA(Gln) amidotransferase subunit A
VDRERRSFTISELADLGVADLLAVFESKRASPVDALRSCLGRIERLDGRVGGVMTLLEESAFAAADESARRWMAGTQRPLEGVPYGLKDIIATEGTRTTGGSPIYEDWIPSTNATVVDRLDASGAVLVAKLRTFELAGGADTITCNPWDLARQGGGSSSGSGVAVSARELPLAIGTDTGGSIAIPAAFVGVTGLKPTYGRVPRTGVMPHSWTLDHVGPLTRSAMDAALALQVIAGHDQADPTSGTAPVHDYLRDIRRGVKGVRIGVPSDWFFDVCDPEIAAATLAATEELAAAGALVGRFELPSTRVVQLHAIEMTIMYAEVASLHSRTYPTLDRYGEDFRRLLIRSQFVLASDYLHGLRTRHLVQQDFERALESFDAVIVPGVVCVAPRHDNLVAKIGPDDVPLQDVLTRTTSPFNIVGMPRITIPSGLDAQGLPIAISIASRPYDEAMSLRVAHTYQEITGFQTLTPPLVREDSKRALASDGGSAHPGATL